MDIERPDLENDAAFTDSLWWRGERPYVVFHGPDLDLEHGPFGYAVHDREGTIRTPVFLDEHFGDRPVDDGVIDDGAWLVAIARHGDGAEGGDRLWTLFWTYPYSPHLHIWILGSRGHRIGYRDLDVEERRAILAAWAGRSSILAVKHLIQLIEDGDTVGARAFFEQQDWSYWARNPEFLWLAIRHHAAFGVEMLPRAFKGACDLLLGMTKRDAAFAFSGVSNLRLGRLVEEIVHQESHNPACPDIAALYGPEEGASAGRSYAMMRSVEFNTLNRFPQKAILDRRLSADVSFFQMPRPAPCDDAICVRIDVTLGPLVERVRIGLMDLCRPLNNRVTYGAMASLYAIARHICHPGAFEEVSERTGFSRGDVVSFYLQLADIEVDMPHSVCWSGRRNNQHAQLVPDIYYTNSVGFSDLRKDIRQRWIPWAERAGKAFWRGSTTGVFFSDDPRAQYPRLRLCQLAAARPDRIDAGFTQIVQYPNQQMGDEIYRYYAESGILKDRVPLIDFIHHRYLIDIDGNTCAWGLMEKLLLGACVFKVESDNFQWYYRRLQPWHHYIPVNADLSDLIDKIDWCEANPDRAAEIAENGRRLALDLDYESQMKGYAESLLRTMTKL